MEKSYKLSLDAEDQDIIFELINENLSLLEGSSDIHRIAFLSDLDTKVKFRKYNELKFKIIENAMGSVSVHGRDDLKISEDESYLVINLLEEFLDEEGINNKIKNAKSLKYKIYDNLLKLEHEREFRGMGLGGIE